MSITAEEALDRPAAVRQMPALIKAYLRLGGTVGEGAFVDHAFNTVDICLILERDAIQGVAAYDARRRAGHMGDTWYSETTPPTRGPGVCWLAAHCGARRSVDHLGVWRIGSFCCSCGWSSGPLWGYVGP